MSRSDPEHDFGEQVLVSGDELRSYTAAESIDQHQAVSISDDYEVSPVSAAGQAGIGVAAYDVGAGQELPVAGDDCEVRVVAGGTVSAGNAATVDADGNFIEYDSSVHDERWGVFNTSGGTGDVVEVYLADSTGGDTA